VAGSLSALAGSAESLLPIEHGVNSDLSSTAGAATASISVTSSIYSLSGGVKDENGVPQARRVRAYRRDTGALVAEIDTDMDNNSYWDMICVGFESAEYTVFAIDLDEAATDFTPPITNRVVSVLRYD
jgi:hypothetical protein